MNREILFSTALGLQEPWKIEESGFALSKKPENLVDQLSMDLSPSFIAGAADFFPAAQITFDRFHVTIHDDINNCAC